MKIKFLLRFYFAVDKVEEHIDRLVIKYAYDPSAEALPTAEKIAVLIEQKQLLGRLWAYLDNIMTGLSVSERNILEYYGFLRSGLKALGAEEVKAVRRVVMKFIRHARRTDCFKREISLLKTYACLTCRGGSSGRACL